MSILVKMGENIEFEKKKKNVKPFLFYLTQYLLVLFVVRRQYIRNNLIYVLTYC
jgi:hypothetical protein